MTRERKYDWEEIKQDYIYGDDTVNLKSISRKRNIPYRTIYKRYDADGWESQRVEYRKERQDETKKKLIEKHSNNVLQVADVLHILNQMVAKKIKKTVDDEQELSDDRIEQYSRVLGINSKRVKMIIGEHTDILKIDDDSTLRKLIRKAEEEKVDGIPTDDDEDDIDLNQAGTHYGPEKKEKKEE